MLSRGLLPFTRCRLCLASLLAGVSSGIDWQCGNSSQPGDNQNLFSLCGLVECVARGLPLRVKPLGRGFRGICTRRLVLCIFMPSVTAIASRTRSMWVDLVVRVGAGGRAGGMISSAGPDIPSRKHPAGGIPSGSAGLGGEVCGFCFGAGAGTVLEARVRFVDLWPCSGLVRRFRVGLRFLGSPVERWSKFIRALQCGLPRGVASQNTDSLSAVRGVLYSGKQM